MSSKKVLITGSAGFIGFHLSRTLLAQGHCVVGLDNLNDYYSVELKNSRNQILQAHSDYTFHRGSLEDGACIKKLFSENQFDTVFHLAAQAGVRYSLENPQAYIDSNITGTLNIFEAVRHSANKPHILAASSSSVYGLSQAYPFTENNPVDQPVALYGATKRANELMGHSYCHLFDLKITMLRFFTVYGPWGRPDMALFLFVKNILENKEIEVFNNGDMIRDFTFVEDIVSGMIELERVRLNPEYPKFDIFNIGCSEPKTLMEFVKAIEKSTKKIAKLKKMPFQPGDIYKTFADCSKLKNISNYAPKTSIDTGVDAFVQWYQEYYNIS